MYQRSFVSSNKKRPAAICIKSYNSSPWRGNTQRNILARIFGINATDAPRGSIHYGPTRRGGSKGQRASLTRSAHSGRVSKCSKVQRFQPRIAPQDYIKKEKEREEERAKDRVERSNKPKGGGAWVKIAVWVFYLFKLGRFVAKNGHANSFALWILIQSALLSACSGI